MQYYISKKQPMNYLTSKERGWLKNNEIEELKKAIYSDIIFIDDPLDLYSKHTMLHDAVILGRFDIFELLLKAGANPMVRDALGYTPLLKAASIGDLKMC